jgi:hypothetical protein
MDIAARHSVGGARWFTEDIIQKMLHGQRMC